MRRIKDNNQHKVEREGLWGKGTVSEVRERDNLYFIVAISDNFDTGHLREFESKGLEEVPEYIGIGSEVSICMWDNDEYIMDLDGDTSKGFV